MSYEFLTKIHTFFSWFGIFFSILAATGAGITYIVGNKITTIQNTNHQNEIIKIKEQQNIIKTFSANLIIQIKKNWKESPSPLSITLFCRP